MSIRLLCLWFCLLFRETLFRCQSQGSRKPAPSFLGVLDPLLSSTAGRTSVNHCLRSHMKLLRVYAGGCGTNSATMLMLTNAYACPESGDGVNCDAHVLLDDTHNQALPTLRQPIHACSSATHNIWRKFEHNWRQFGNMLVLALWDDESFCSIRQR